MSRVILVIGKENKWYLKNGFMKYLKEGGEFTSDDHFFSKIFTKDDSFADLVNSRTEIHQMSS